MAFVHACVMRNRGATLKENNALWRHLHNWEKNSFPGVDENCSAPTAASCFSLSLSLSLSASLSVSLSLSLSLSLLSLSLFLSLSLSLSRQALHVSFSQQKKIVFVHGGYYTNSVSDKPSMILSFAQKQWAVFFVCERYVLPRTQRSDCRCAR